MTLEEAIKHAEQKYNEEMESAKAVSQLHGINVPGYMKHYKCATEHKQLADWLKELQFYRGVDR